MSHQAPSLMPQRAGTRLEPVLVLHCACVALALVGIA
jgi:hypothetical protein